MEKDRGNWQQRYRVGAKNGVDEIAKDKHVIRDGESLCFAAMLFFCTRRKLDLSRSITAWTDSWFVAKNPLVN